MNTTTISVDTSRGLAAELLRDIQQRNYGAAETKARQLWNRLGREAQAMRKACDMIKATLDEIERKIEQRLAKAQQADTKPDIFLKEMDYRISNLNNAHPQTQHSEGMRTGFMYARAIYKGIQK